MMFSLLMLSAIAFGKAHIYMLPSSTIQIDGSTEVTYKFQMLSPSFEPVKNYKGIVKLSNGQEASLSAKKSGIYTASFTFDENTKTEALKVSLSGKVTYVTKDGKVTTAVDETFSQHVRATTKPVYKITSEIKDAIDTEGRLTFEVSSTQNIDPSFISLGTSLGKIVDITQKSPNTLEFKVDDSKKRKFPHYYIIALTDLRFEDVHSTFALPKSGKVSFPIKDVQPNSKVSIKIGDTTFGPSDANSEGKAFVKITVPPGVNKGKTIIEHKASKATLDLDLMIPTTKDVMIFPMLDIPADPTRSFDVYFYTTLKDPSIDDFELSANKGAVGEIQSLGDNKFTFQYTPKYSELGETDTLVVKNTKTSQKDRLKVQLRAYIPDNTVITTPSSLGKSATQLEVEVSGNYDVQKISRQPSAYVISGNIDSLPTELPHKVQISTIGDGPLEVTGYYPSTPTTNPFDHLVIDTSQSRIPNDGKSVCLVTVVSVDKYGYPVGNQEFSINQEIGDGILFGEQKTNALGFAHLLFRAGSTEGLNLFEIRTEIGQSEVAIYQFQNTTATTIENIPFSGTTAMIEEAAFWDKAISSQRVDRENSFDLPLTSERNPNVEAVGELSIHLQTPRKILAFGERVELTFEIKDEKGNRIPVEKPVIFAEAGQLTGLENPSGGVFSTTLVVPEEGIETLEISVSSGEIEKDFLFSVAEKGDAVADASSFDGEEEEKPPKEKRVRTPRTKGSGNIEWGVAETPMPWLSATLSYTHGQYSYQQVPNYLDGLLYYKSITFNRQAEGSSPATTAGYQSNFHVHHPKFPYVGLEYRFHVDLYRIGLPGYTSAIYDFLIVNDYFLTAQYPISVSGFTFYPTLRVGQSSDSILLFLQEEYLEDDTKVSTQNISLNSSQFGVGLFVQSNAGAFGEFSYEKGFQGGAYRDKTHLTLGYNHKEKRSWFVTFRGNVRELNLEDEAGLSEGTLIDQHMTIGAGFKYRR